MESGIPLADSYRRYKNGTNTIAKWLVRAARACGISVTSTKSAGTTKRYLLTTEHFVHLAHSIARQRNLSIGVDSALLATLREVIQLRTAANEFFEKYSYAESQEQSNATHAYFITVLQEVLQVLEPLVAAAHSWTLPADPVTRAKKLHANVPSPTVASADDEPEDDIDNTLEHSSASMPVRQQVNQRARARKRCKPQTKRKDKPLPPSEEFEVESTVEDLYLTLFCFFKDLDEVRRYINNLWKGYAAGETTLIAASITTDLAMGAVQRKENDFLATEVFLDGKLFTLDEVFKNLQAKRSQSEFSRFWRYGDDSLQLRHWYLGELLFDHIYQLGEQPIWSDDEAIKAFDDTMYALADWLGLPSFAWLDYVQIWVSEKLGDKTGPPEPVMYLFDESSTEAVRLMDRLSFNLKMLHYVHALGEYFLTHRGDLSYSPAQDVWTKEILAMIAASFREVPQKKKKKKKNKKDTHATSSPQRHLTTSLVWSTTVMLDIPWTLDSAGDNAFSELKHHAHMAQATIQRYTDWCDEYRFSNDDLWNKLNKVWFFTERYIDHAHFKNSVSTRRSIDFGAVFDKNPVWCGILVFWIKISLFQIFIKITNILQITVICIHWYNMAKNACGIEMNWPDVEYIINLHGEEHLFYGSRPADYKKCESRLRMAVGLPSTSRLRMAVGLPSTEIATNTYVANLGKLSQERGLRKEALPSYLLAAKYSMFLDDTEKQPTQGTFQATDPASLLLSVTRRGRPSSDISQDNSYASLVNLLSTLSQILDEDSEHLEFNYFDFVRKGCELSARYKANLPKIASQFPPDRKEHEWLMRLVFTLCEALDIAKTTTDDTLADRGPDLLAPLVHFTKQHGSDVLNKRSRRTTQPSNSGSASPSETVEGGSSSAIPQTRPPEDEDESAMKKKKSHKTQQPTAANVETALSLASVQGALPNVMGTHSFDESVARLQAWGLLDSDDDDSGIENYISNEFSPSNSDFESEDDSVV